MENKEIFTEDILNKYADVLIWGLEAARKSTGGKYKKGDIIYVGYELNSLKLAEILYKKLLQKGMNVIVRMRATPKMQFDFYDVANNEQLKFLAPWSKGLYKNLNGIINLIAPASLTHLSDIDSKKNSACGYFRKTIERNRAQARRSRRFRLDSLYDADRRVGETSENVQRSLCQRNH